MARQKVSGIYLITCKRYGYLPLLYVGQSTDCFQRWIHHKSDLKGGRHPNWKLRKAYSANGREAFSFSVLEECPPESLNAAEQFWLDELLGHKRCLNLASDATSGMRGRRHTAETKAKLSATHKSGSAPWTGKKLSDEHRKKLSESHMGKTQSQQAKDKLRKANGGVNHPNYGKKRPPEVVEKMRASQRKRAVIGINLAAQDIIFLFCLEESASAGFNKWHVASCANGKERHHKGYTWRWLNAC